MRTDRSSATRQPAFPKVWRFGLFGLAALLILAASASAASAAPSKFVYELCDSALPSGADPQLSFTVNPGVPISYFDNCSQPNGAIGVAEHGHTAQTFAYLSVAVPNTPGGWVETETVSGVAAGLGPGNDHSYIVEGDWPVNNGGETHRAFFVASGPGFLGSGGGFSILLNCDGSYSPGCEAGAVLAAHYIAATEVDPNPPTLPSVTGSLLAPGVLRGHQELSVEALDEGGGVSQVEALVNGVVAAAPTASACSIAQVANPSYTGTVALVPSPCPPKVKSSWTVDTATYPFHDGVNSVQVCASDFATFGEANKTCSSPQTVEVDNSCTESSVAGGVVLSAQFARSHKGDATVPYGSGAKVTGRLTDTAGTAIPGATICVQTATQGSRRGLQPVGTATTDANGRFVYAASPGPNRELLMGYRHDAFQVGQTIHIYSHTKPSIRVSRSKLHNGGEIKITGKLPGNRAGGRDLILEAAALHGKRWYPFESTTTNKEGIYHGRYRFDATTETTIYKIRADAPRQHNWPWEEGHSKPALVEVRG